jgi:hypothetical protein
MTRSRSTSRVGSMSLLQPAGCPRKGSRPLLLLLLLGLLSGSPAAWAQPSANTPAPRVTTDSASTTSAAPAAQPASHWSTVWAVLGGVAIGALGVWFFVRKSQATDNPVVVPDAPSPKPTPAPIDVPEPVRKKPAENVRKSPPAEPPAESTGKGVSFQSMREVQGTTPKQPAKPSGKDKRNQPNFNSRNAPATNSSKAWPPIAPRPSAMNPTSSTPPPTGDNQPLEPGQTIEWAAPTSTPPAIQELIDSSANEPAATEAAPETAAPAASNGPLHYYAPAPDVPSIEHRKLSPNPLPQMPLLITLPSAEAVTAQFSFSPQADQSRIIGNGVRELKEFFQFELPPTEQFTTIKNLKAGKLEKRDDAWHVVQKAEIALS